MADICLVIIIVLFAYVGKKRGFLRSVISTLSTLISLFLSVFLCKPVSMLVLESEIGEELRTTVEKFLVAELETQPHDVIESAIQSATTLIVNVIAFVAVLILIRVAVSFAARILNIASKLPVIKQANSLLGLVSGVICGIIVCYISVGVLGAFGTEGQLAEMVNDIKESYFAYYLYDGNIIMKTLIK